MNVSNIINKNKYKINNIITILLCLSLFRELKTQGNIFLNFFHYLGSISLYLSIIILIIYSFFCTDKKNF